MEHKQQKCIILLSLCIFLLMGCGSFVGSGSSNSITNKLLQRHINQKSQPSQSLEVRRILSILAITDTANGQSNCTTAEIDQRSTKSQEMFEYAQDPQRENSALRLALDVTPTIVLDNINTGGQTRCLSLEFYMKQSILSQLATTYPSINPDDFQMISVTFIGGSNLSCSLLGWASGNWTFIREYAFSSTCPIANWKILAHEWGHHLGLRHASRHNYTYGDFSDIMGATPIRGVLNGPHLAQLNWRNVTTLSIDGPPQTISGLYSSQLNDHILKMNVGNHNYYVSYRRGLETPTYDLLQEFRNKVSIHGDLVPPNMTGLGPVDAHLYKLLEPSDANGYITPHGIKITTSQSSPEQITVQATQVGHFTNADFSNFGSTECSYVAPNSQGFLEGWSSYITITVQNTSHYYPMENLEVHVKASGQSCGAPTIIREHQFGPGQTMEMGKLCPCGFASFSFKLISESDPSRVFAQKTFSNPQHRIFVTSTSHQGNLGGLKKADQVCQVRAKAAKLQGSWRAILSNATTNAKNRIQVNGSVRRLKLEDVFQGIFFQFSSDAIVVEHSQDLFEGVLQNSITYTEFQNVTKSLYVWTGTEQNGSSHLNHCSSWKKTESTGHVDIYTVRIITFYPKRTNPV